MLIVLVFTANYKTARLKLPQAETNTDDQTAGEENEDIQKKKRKRLCVLKCYFTYCRC